MHLVRKPKSERGWHVPNQKSFALHHRLTVIWLHHAPSKLHFHNLQSLQATVCSNQQKDTKKTYHRKRIWYILFMFPLETKTSCTTHLDLLRKKYRRQFAIYLTKRFFLTDTFICSFNNKALEKCTSDKALNSVTTVCFFATLITEQPADLWCF